MRTGGIERQRTLINRHLHSRGSGSVLILVLERKVPATSVTFGLFLSLCSGTLRRSLTQIIYKREGVSFTRLYKHRSMGESELLLAIGDGSCSDGAKQRQRACDGSLQVVRRTNKRASYSCNRSISLKKNGGGMTFELLGFWAEWNFKSWLKSVQALRPVQT